MLRRPDCLAPLSCVLALALAVPASAGDVEVQLGTGDGFVVKDNTGFQRLRVDEATGNISRNGALFVHTTGGTATPRSTFVGEGAGNPSNTGQLNTALGYGALASLTSANYNTAVGAKALYDNTGARNTAMGSFALYDNTTGSGNVAIGDHALANNTTGSDNVAIGRYGLNAYGTATTGSRNIAIGAIAGFDLVSGNDNIYLASLSASGAESGQIRIGTTGTHTQAQIAGIHGNTSSSGIAVYVNASGTLGTATSSERFKQNVRDLDDTSAKLMALRPVTFEYREGEIEEGGEPLLQYGLIAEEVAEVAPELVAFDAEGKPYTVRYRTLPPLMLKEVQEQHARDDAQQAEIEALLARVEQLESQLASSQESASR